MKAELRQFIRERPRVRPETLTPDQRALKRLVHTEFRFSQGDPLLHNDFTRWLHHNGYLEGHAFPEITPDFIEDIRPPSLHENTIESVNIIDTRRAWGHTRWIVTNEKEPPEDLVGRILHGMIERDLDYQASGRPRPKTDDKTKEDSPADQYASMVRKFVLQGQASGVESFDRLLGELGVRFREESRGIIETGIDEKLTVLQERILELEEQWQSRHEGISFAAPDRESYANYEGVSDIDGQELDPNADLEGFVFDSIPIDEGLVFGVDTEFGVADDPEIEMIEQSRRPEDISYD